MSARQRRGIEAACMDMWEPFRLSIEQWAPSCRIVYDKFHIIQHANAAIDEVRRAEFFRKGRRMRGLVKGKRWLLLSRWVNLAAGKRQELNQLFALNRKVGSAQESDRPPGFIGFLRKAVSGTVDVWRWRDSPGANADGGFRSIQALLGVARATQRTSARQAPCSWPRAGDRYATAADAEPSGLRRIGALEGASPLGRMALNLHRMKKFQGTAELSWVGGVPPTLRK